MVAGIISIIALVAFVASASDEHSGEADLLVKSQKGLQASKADKDTLAATLLMSVLHSTPENSKRILRTWRDHQIAHLDSFGSTQMLRQQKSIKSIRDISNSSICASKDVVINQLNQLADQIEAQIAAYNATDAAKLSAQTNAHQAWLDTESDYRLKTQKAQDASEGSQYSAQRYEKWAEAVQETQNTYNLLAAQYASSSVSDSQEEALLQSIIQMLGTITTLKTKTAQSLKATGGKGAAAALYKPKEKLIMAEIKAKVGELKQLAIKDKSPQLAAIANKGLSLARLTRLAGVADVIALLQNMINQLEQHDASLAAQVAAAQANLVSHQAKLTKYQENVVNLANAADESHNDAQVANLQRQNLAGAQITAQEDYQGEHADYTLSVPPLQAEYDVIQTVIDKIDAFCAA